MLVFEVNQPYAYIHPLPLGLPLHPPHPTTKKNEIGSFVEMWVDLESIKQSEVSQKEKNKYHILTHLCGI